MTGERAVAAVQRVIKRVKLAPSCQSSSAMNTRLIST